MIQMQTNLDVADNSGARRVQCIKVLGGSKRRTATVGDVIIVSVKEAIPRGRVKKGDVHRAVIVRTAKEIRRVGRVWIRIFPDVPVSSKPAEVRMGSGKGSPEFWVARVKPGRIMFELDGVTLEVAREAFELAAAKLPIATRFVTRPGEEAVT